MAMPGQEGESQPIIIKKAKKGGGGHHGGAWKVAYADFVTAMMALFIVLWILSSSEETKQAIADYFNDPMGVNVGKGPTLIDQDNSSLAPKVLDEEAFRRKEEEKLKQMGEEIAGKLNESPEFQTMMDQIKIEIVPEGLRIELMESENEAFFEISTANLKAQPRMIIEKIGGELSKLSNKLIVEGHTDATKFSGGALGYTNYELSADRANSARRSLIVGGLNEDQIDEVRGYAANRLKLPDNPYSSANRRISIIVRYNVMK